ncbi:hypothetical protein RHSIM_Rhsim02G0136700 [Rhododendron simsii]|uniref:Transcription elongation factor 1 homolog n=1 Tax=Rhododendron simsii TaxID=118357 RepID=A0A834HCT0_RHOSS|nr:hypothetical protein RHSIM_Rhsim02G0136700 [Rhododendron simsii]
MDQRCLYLPVITYSDDTLIDSCEEQDLNYGEEEVKSKATTKKGWTSLTLFSVVHSATMAVASVECRIDLKNSIGEAISRICLESFSTTVTALTEPIDIYSEWIDECELVNNVDDDGAE